MTLEQLAYLAEIIGVAAIIISLMYVARQLHQNNELLKSQSRQSLLTNDKLSIQRLIDERELFELLSKPKPLPFQDQFRFTMLQIMYFRDREYEYFQYKAGALDEAAWLSYRDIIKLLLDSERRMKWWNNLGSKFLIEHLSRW